MWGHIKNGIQRVLAALPKDVVVAGALGIGDAVAAGNLIAFNGAVPRAGESFHVWRVIDDPSREIKRYGLYHSYCKTGGLPYDLAVTAALLVLKHYLGDQIVIVSDGGNAEWDAAKALCYKTFGWGPEWTFLGDAKELTLYDGTLGGMKKQATGSVPV